MVEMWRGTSISACTSLRSSSRLDIAARAAEAQRQAGEHRELAGERLGRGDADLGTGERRQHDVGFARDGGGAHVDDGGDALRFGLGVAQHGERVGGLARLRDEQRQAALGQRRLAVAHLGGDVDLDGQARVALDPVLADEPGVVGGAAGRHGDARQACRVDAEIGKRDGRFRHVDVVGQRVADDFRLLVDFLRHEVAMVALVDEQRSWRPT